MAFNTSGSFYKNSAPLTVNWQYPSNIPDGVNDNEDEPASFTIIDLQCLPAEVYQSFAAVLDQFSALGFLADVPFVMVSSCVRHRYLEARHLQ